MRQSVVPVLTLLLGATSASGAAAAHGVPPAGLAPFVVDGELVGGATTYGFLRDDGAAGRWQWTCEEAGPGEPRGHVFVDEGLVVIPRGRGLFVSVDNGCDFAPMPALDGTFVSTAVAQGGAPGDRRLVLALAEPGQDGALAVLDGAPPAEVMARLALPRLQPERVVVLDEARVLVSGTEPGVGPRAVLAHLYDGSLLEVSLPLDTVRSRGVGVGPGPLPDGGSGASNLAWLHLERGGGLQEVVSVLDDGTVGVATAVPGPVLDVVVRGDVWIVLFDDGQLFRGAPASLASVTLDTLPPFALPLREGGGAPVTCLVEARPLDLSGGGPLFACSGLRDRDFLRSDDDGATWTSVVQWDDIVPRACPAGSTGGDVCPVFWGILQSGYGIGMRREADAGPPGGNASACSSCGSGADVALLSFLVVPLRVASLQRRRRRDHR